MDGDTIPSGLGTLTKDLWPKVTQADLDAAPIDRLRPGSDLHRTVLEYLMNRIKFSERKMGNFTSRWRFNELRTQAYVQLPDYEQALKDMTASKQAPAAVSIVVPYSFAAMMTISTYHLHTFAGHRPMFQIGSDKAETAKSAENMEIVLQHQADHTRFIAKLWQWLLDMQIYGLAIMRTTWKDQKEMRTVWKKPQGVLGMMGLSPSVKSREMRTVYSGNDVTNVDPFMFFPDPRVPMTKVNRDGEYVFWREFLGKHLAKIYEADGLWKYVDYAGNMPTRWNVGEGDSVSNRDLLSRGTAHPGRDSIDSMNMTNSMQADQGSVVIIPAELGLGEATKPEKWLFTVLNRRQIVQAEPLQLDHGMHPVAVTEPYGLGYSFGQAGMADYVGGLQDIMSWLVNSHIHNVRTALNNTVVADPSRVEMQDIKNPAPGKVIRVKPAGYGQDPSTMLQQFQVTDVTKQHLQDLAVFIRLADSLTGVNDNVRGLQDSGSRKTATEVRTSGEAAASRLAAQSRIISAQGLVDLTEQMAVNTQQFLDDAYFVEIVGQAAASAPIKISPEMLVGDFNYPVSDGTLPTDRVALLDVWKEIYLGISQDPALTQLYDRGAIFEFIAELGGAKNLGQFKLQVLPDEQIAQMQSQGNLVPMGGARGRSPGQTPGIAESPANRMAGPPA